MREKQDMQITEQKKFSQAQIERLISGIEKLNANFIKSDKASSKNAVVMTRFTIIMFALTIIQIGLIILPIPSFLWQRVWLLVCLGAGLLWLGREIIKDTKL